MNPLIQPKTIISPLLITLTLLCFGFFPIAQAVVPPPDGGYPGFNTAEGQNALFSLTTGAANTAVGWFSLWGNATGEFNTATGAGALLFNNGDPTAGEASENTAFGAAALLFNTTGAANTAVGAAALLNNTEGSLNTATGYQALTSNTIGQNNTANGAFALQGNTEGRDNTATGHQALAFNTIGGGNTADGYAALINNTIGNNNTANGAQALINNTIGNNNTGDGTNSLFSNTDGNENTATGKTALGGNINGSDNTADGFLALVGITSGSSNNIALGANAGSNLTSGSNNIYLGSMGVATESNTIRIGTAGTQTSAFIRGIRGVTTGNNDAIPVLIDTAGQLGTTSSSLRYKKDIKAMEQASKAILSLKPVTFHYQSDTKDTPQFGLIAEEVAEVNPDLVVRDENGEIYTVRYEAVNAMLLNEFLKEHRACLQEQRKVQQLEANGAEQQKEITLLRSELKEQRALIQKVNDKVDLKQSSPKVVATD
jgi:hypothetical protein